MTTSANTASANTTPDIDYSSFFSGIITAIDGVNTTLSVNLVSLNNTLSSINTKLGSIDNSLSETESHINVLKEKGIGSGIHILSPYELVNLSSIYNVLVNKAEILNPENNASKEDRQKSVEEIKTIIDQIQTNFPPSF